MISSEHIIKQARTWLGTPFHHQGRLKGKGCDCLGLIVGVATELNLKSKKGKKLASYDETNYSKTPDSNYLIKKLSCFLKEVPIKELCVGDIALFIVGTNPQHLALISNYEETLGMIHCDAQIGCVVEHRLDDNWLLRLTKVFRWQQ